MQVSKLHVYSLAIVAANKALSSRDIECTPIEDLPMTDGEITDHTERMSAGAKDTLGASYSVEVQATSTVKATWLPMGSSNRMTAPDVRRGETVVLYRFADTDEYWWTTLKDDMHLRKLETVIYAFSATRDEGKPTAADTSYFIEVSTHKKLVHLHTCRADGEPFAYDIQLNTAEGFFTIQDDAGNSIQLDSRNRRLQMFNRDGSILDLNKTKMSLFTKESIDIKTTTLSMASSNMNLSASNLNANSASGDFVIAGISHTKHKHPETQIITGPPM